MQVNERIYLRQESRQRKRPRAGLAQGR